MFGESPSLVLRLLMIQISAGQMDDLAGCQRLHNLLRICEQFSRDDPALAQGRDTQALLPLAERACTAATALQLKSTGAVAIVMTLLLVIEGDPNAATALRPLLDALRDTSRSEAARVAAVRSLLFDLDQSLPPELRGDGPAAVTPELTL